MYQLLIQATQPSGFRSWGVVEWSFIIGTVSTAIIAVIGAWRGNVKADSATKTADRAEAVAVNANDKAIDAKSDAKSAVAVANVNTQRISNQAAGLHRVLHNAPPPGEQNSRVESAEDGTLRRKQ